MDEKYAVRDLRTRYAWQSQNALRILYENFDGVESKNLVNLYVALTLKSTFCGFADEFDTTSKAICEYTHTSPDWIATGFKLLSNAGLIHVEDRRSARGYMLGKTITLTDAPRFEKTGTSKTGTSFLGIQNKEDISKDSIVKDISKDSTINIPNGITQRTVKAQYIDSETWDYVKDIFNHSVEVGMSKPTVSYEDGVVTVPKHVKDAITKLGQIADGTFAATHKIQDFPITKDNWREKIIIALDNWKAIYEDKRLWPYDKSKMPRTVNNFIYNPATGFSWLVKCLEPLETTREQHVNRVYDNVTDNHIKLFDKWIHYYFYEMTPNEEVTMKQNIGELIKEHKRLWETYGIYYTKQGKWRQYLGGEEPTIFISKFVEYLIQGNWKAHVSALNPNNTAFRQYLSYLQKEYNIPLNLTEKQLKDLRGENEVKTLDDFVIPEAGEGVISYEET